MATEVRDLPKATVLDEKEIVEELANSVELHGWKVTSYTVSVDREKEEKTLTVKVWRSTGDAQQTTMDLNENGRTRRRRSTTPAADAGTEAGE